MGGAAGASPSYVGQLFHATVPMDIFSRYFRSWTGVIAQGHKQLPGKCKVLSLIPILPLFLPPVIFVTLSSCPSELEKETPLGGSQVGGSDEEQSESGVKEEACTEPSAHFTSQGHFLSFSCSSWYIVEGKLWESVKVQRCSSSTSKNV